MLVYRIDKTMLLNKTFKPTHTENRMKYEGDVHYARDYFYKKACNNLKLLLANRYAWMNQYINEHDTGIEVGCGMGISKDFIKNNHFKITDLADYDWLDIKNIDALDTQLQDNSLNFVVASNMLHHVSYPMKFLQEMARILKPGGYLLIQEVNLSLLMRYLLRLMKHEGYDYSINVFDSNQCCTDPNDLWSANCAIPNLLFNDSKQFEDHFPFFKLIKHDYDECFCLLNSGGVIAKTLYIPLPKFLIKGLQKLDLLLANLAPKLFALQQHMVLQKQWN